MNRARIIASTPKIYKQEITNLKELFFNGYPKKFVNDVINRSININKDCTKTKTKQLRLQKYRKGTLYWKT